MNQLIISFQTWVQYFQRPAIVLLLTISLSSSFLSCTADELPASPQDVSKAETFLQVEGTVIDNAKDGDTDPPKNVIPPPPPPPPQP